MHGWFLDCPRTLRILRTVAVTIICVAGGRPIFCTFVDDAAEKLQF